MINRNRTFASLALISLAASPWGCGGSSSSTSPTPVAAAPVPTPTPCAQTALFQATGGMPSGTVMSQPTAVPAAGRLDITADWTHATNPVGLYVVQGACNLEAFNARSCNFLLRVEPGAKPLKGSATVQVGNYSVLLANFGTREDSGAINVVLSTGSCPAATSAPGSAATTGNPQVQRARMFR